MNKFIARLAIISATLVGFSGLASATPVVNPPVTSPTQLTASTANDLILNGSGTFSGSSFVSGSLAFGNALSNLTDGIFPDGPSGIPALPLSAGLSNGAQVQFLLNTAAAPNGYDLTSFVTTTGWTDNRVGQNYTLYYTTVSDPSTLHQLAIVNAPTNGGSEQVTITDTTGVLAQHVGAIDVVVNNSGGSESIYQEFVLNGSASVPEPSSMLLAGFGALGLFIAVRRRCKA